jgi:hypothetical protein
MSESRIDTFAALARSYCEWAESPTDIGEDAEVANALSHLSSLYVAALQLPEGEPGDGEIESTSQEEWRKIYLRFGSLPVDRYFEVFNPLE